MIIVENLSKDFIIHKKDPGLLGTVKSLFRPKKEIKRAVDGISFKIDSGEMVGYIGANGAGKSTTIKMMTGILNPTSGHAEVHGLVPYKERMKNSRQIGVVFGQRTQLWWDLPLRETFTILKEIYQVSTADFTPRMKYLDEVLGLEEFLGQPVRTLSLGQRMRADLAASLLHNPKVLFLDEPTIGLDIVVKEKVLGAIKDINRQYGTTVILTTHDMADIEQLCSRIIIIDEGKKVHDGSLEAIKDTYGFMRTLVMEIREPEKVAGLGLAAAFKLEEKDLIQTLAETTLTLRFNSHRVKASDLLFHVMQRLPVLDMKVMETSIEEIVKGIYQGRGL